MSGPILHLAQSFISEKSGLCDFILWSGPDEGIHLGGEKV